MIINDGNIGKDPDNKGQDTAKEADRVKAVATAVWTKEVVDEFKAKKEALLREVPK